MKRKCKTTVSIIHSSNKEKENKFSCDLFEDQKDRQSYEAFFNFVTGNWRAVHQLVDMLHDTPICIQK